MNQSHSQMIALKDEKIQELLQKIESLEASLDLMKQQFNNMSKESE